MLYRRRHDVVGTTNIDVEGDLPIIPQYRQVDYSVHTLRRIHHLILIANVYFQELVMALSLVFNKARLVVKTPMGLSYIGETKIVRPRKHP